MKGSCFKGCFFSKEGSSVNKIVILNLTQHLRRLLLPFLNGVRGRFRIKYEMTTLCNKAFTLIELLVVVLITGILAAVAVPQYQKAVEKSRALEGIMLTRAILDAQQFYFLENGTYTKNLNDLDIKIPGREGTPTGHALSVQSAKYFDCSAASTGTDDNIIAFCKIKGSVGYYIHGKRNKKVLCGWGSGSPQGAKWCKLLTGQEVQNSIIKF